MTTENGLPLPRKVRAHIKVLRDHHAWLCCYADDREAIGLPAALVRRQIEAFEWALPVLEAEWDAVTRLHREIVSPAEVRLYSFERQAEAVATSNLQETEA